MASISNMGCVVGNVRFPGWYPTPTVTDLIAVTFCSCYTLGTDTVIILQVGIYSKDCIWDYFLSTIMSDSFWL